MSIITTKIVRPTDGAAGFLGSIGVRFMIDGPESQQRFALVEHLMSSRALRHRCTATRGRTSTASSSRGAWVRCLATTS